MKRSPYDMRSWELQRSDVPALLKLLKNSHKFLIGSALWQICWEFGNELITHRIFQIPFNTVLFEYTEEINSNRRITLIAYKGKEFPDDVIVLPFARHDNSSWSGGPDYAMVLDQKADKPIWHVNNYFTQTTDYAFKNNQLILTDLFTATVGLINIKDSEQTLVEIPDRLHKARKGKPPLYEFKFVELSTKSYEREYRGGTHASPALHWRRGHFRKLASDKIVPVAPCVVGSLENGIVEKAYDGRRLNPTKNLKLTKR